MRNYIAIATSLLLGVTVVGCGGSTSNDEVASRVAPQWMAELDLPGCFGAETPGRASLRLSPTELLSHPADDRLVVVTSGGEPTCITDKNQFVDPAGVHVPFGFDVSTVDDDPIPLVRERDTPGEEGEVEQGGDPASSALLAGNPPEDDPIPLVRERDMESAQPGHLPGEKKN